MRRPLTIQEILRWADTHREATGRWPTVSANPVIGTHSETWQRIDSALKKGLRGLPGGKTLAQLLVDKRGAPHRRIRPPLGLEKILQWADAYHERNDRWPSNSSGAISESRGDTWQAIDEALRQGRRGLAGRSSLAKLLAEHRGVRNRIPR